MSGGNGTRRRVISRENALEKSIASADKIRSQIETLEAASDPSPELEKDLAWFREKLNKKLVQVDKMQQQINELNDDIEEDAKITRQPPRGIND